MVRSKRLKAYGGFVVATHYENGQTIQAIAAHAYSHDEAREKFRKNAIADFPPDNGLTSITRQVWLMLAR